MSFKGRTALVTGGARGIGRCIADALVDAGARVHVFDVGDDPRAAFSFRRVDVSDAAQVRAGIAALPPATSLLVNNAGIARDRSLLKMSDAEWSEVLDVNLSGAFYVLREVAGLMARARHGRIVNISSINALRGKFGQANYTAAKAGLVGLTKTAARELGPKGITVNAVAPGMVMTELTRSLPAEAVGAARDQAVLGRLAEAGDVAHAVLFLLSDAARSITGEVLRVDGGQYLHA
ncbi:MAG: SDR family oxidoreductase [Myxococcaceae bacterium]|nr:SDR family oxidoreductase [Myxococcaceae bacterium]